MKDQFSLSVVPLCLKILDKKVLNIEDELSKIKMKIKKEEKKERESNPNSAKKRRYRENIR